MEKLAEEEKRHLQAAIESVLFSMGDAVELGQLAKAIEQDKEVTGELVTDLMERYRQQDGGLQIIALNGCYQMCTKKEFSGCLIRIALQPKKPVLTDIMMETLSIIAYKQPVTKIEVEKIRGVKSDHAINKLLEYNLIRELGRMDAPGRPILFGTTEDFLRYFGVSDVDELPAVDPVRLEDFRSEAEEEVSLKLDV